jgi:hypothetical protein
MRFAVSSLQCINLFSTYSPLKCAERMRFPGGRRCRNQFRRGLGRLLWARARCVARQLALFSFSARLSLPRRVRCTYRWREVVSTAHFTSTATVFFAIRRPLSSDVFLSWLFPLVGPKNSHFGAEKEKPTRDALSLSQSATITAAADALSCDEPPNCIHPHAHTF